MPLSAKEKNWSIKRESRMINASHSAADFVSGNVSQNVTRRRIKELLEDLPPREDRNAGVTLGRGGKGSTCKCQPSSREFAFFFLVKLTFPEAGPRRGRIPPQHPAMQIMLLRHSSQSISPAYYSDRSAQLT